MSTDPDLDPFSMMQLLLRRRVIGTGRTSGRVVLYVSRKFCEDRHRNRQDRMANKNAP